jgi:2-amino-4-hydroxy-6-hydroxymethyldihydropteridine diphosphokinase
VSVAAGEPVFVALGSNLGDRDGHLTAAREALAQVPGTRLVAASAIEETAPLGGLAQPAYLNQMVLLDTELEPHQLLAELQAIEQRRGRVRGDRWGSRTLDLDIVAWGDRRIHDPDLIIPHPELPRRDFWQRELSELARI